MEKIIMEAIDKHGFPIVMCLLIGYIAYKIVTDRIKKQDERIDKMENRNQEDRQCFLDEITSLKLENKEDKHMFKDAMNLFRESVNEFKSFNKEINSKVDSIQDDVKITKDDITEIKQIIEYKAKEK
ncbi:hypothetical protein [Clostridium perfringens]|jgi:hypothetical protein|uniref:Phage protein n=1 Tax=Clostridium perfringens TaxID=1502 RepID=A0AAW4J428_CLOPF|nr:hypothetical protein [Clostridium perfringens]MBO3356231.1 hypothetical protein [Clostridium perfringens]MBO3359428.1 hypothetical protein [Clostridium perfringens]